jgi:hypothetical protein
MRVALLTTSLLWKGSDAVSKNSFKKDHNGYGYSYSQNEEKDPIWSRASNRSRRECDPHQQQEPDVGILTVSIQSCNDCREDASSSLGGYCYHSELETHATTSTHRRGRHRLLQSPDQLNNILSACESTLSQDERCDCSQFPESFQCQLYTNQCYEVTNSTSFGNIDASDGHADYIQICFDQSVTVQQESGYSGWSLTYCTQVHTPMTMDYCLTGVMDHQMLQTCSVELNGETCNRCTVGPCSEFETATITSFDCSNTIMVEKVGDACLGDLLFPLLNGNRKYPVGDEAFDGGYANASASTTLTVSQSYIWLVPVGVLALTAS